MTNKKENLKDKVYATVKQKIITFQLKPGEKFFETEMADILGVSRTPIREALNKLEQEGLIRALPNRGYSVSDLTRDEIEELYEIREALEVLALRSAVKNACKEDWIRLEQALLSRSANLPKRSGPLGTAHFKEAHEFHEEIARISGKAVLRWMMNMVSDRIKRFEWLNVFLKDRADNSRKEHIEIVRLIEENKIEEAVTAAKEHVRHSKETLLRFLEAKKGLLHVD